MRNLIIIVLLFVIFTMYYKIDVKVNKNSKEYKTLVDTVQKTTNNLFEKIK